MSQVTAKLNILGNNKKKFLTDEKKMLKKFKYWK